MELYHRQKFMEIVEEMRSAKQIINRALQNISDNEVS
jgi:hypothetical protein